MVQNNDDIIELTDQVVGDSSDEDTTGIIELTDIAPGAEDEAVPPAVEDHLALNDEVDTQGTPGDNEGFEDDQRETGSAADLSQVGREEFEAALERVIEKKFSQTIEKILFEVMEKVIQKEIADIKASLQKDLDDIGRP